jgi:hypothetical protein
MFAVPDDVTASSYPLPWSWAYARDPRVLAPWLGCAALSLALGSHRLRAPASDARVRSSADAAIPLRPRSVVPRPQLAPAPAPAPPDEHEEARAA